MGGATYSAPAVPVVGMCKGVITTPEAEEAVASSASRYFNSAMHIVKVWYANPSHQQVYM